MLIRANHFHDDRLITNPVECDILDAQSSSLSGHGLYFFSGSSSPFANLSDDVIKKVNVKMAFHCQFIIFFELIRPNDIVMLIIHSFNALNASSTSE